MFPEVRPANSHEDLSQLVQKQELMMYFSPFLYSRNFANQNIEKPKQCFEERPAQDDNKYFNHRTCIYCDKDGLLPTPGGKDDQDLDLKTKSAKKKL